jgi:hypothetical protein
MNALSKDALLRVHAQRLRLRHTEELIVEILEIFDVAAPRVRNLGAEPSGRRSNRAPALRQKLPKLFRATNPTRESAANPYYAYRSRHEMTPRFDSRLELGIPIRKESPPGPQSVDCTSTL